MQENTETQTEQINPETTPEVEVQKSPEELASETIRIAKQLSKGENLLLERELWAYMNALTQPNVSELKKYQIKQSMQRAIRFGVNFLSGNSPVQLQNFGQLSQIENNLARAIVKLGEYGTLQMAENLRKQDEANEAARLAAEGKTEEGVKPLSELQTEEYNNETKE